MTVLTGFCLRWCRTGGLRWHRRSRRDFLARPWRCCSIRWAGRCGSRGPQCRNNIPRPGLGQGWAALMRALRTRTAEYGAWELACGAKVGESIHQHPKPKCSLFSVIQLLYLQTRLVQIKLGLGIMNYWVILGYLFHNQRFKNR